MENIYTITDIKAENASGTRYAATINGDAYSGIEEGSRFWQPLQEAIAEGATVEPFVPYVPTALEQLAQTDAKLLQISARQIEDVITERQAAGKFVPQDVLDIIAERQGLRE